MKKTATLYIMILGLSINFACFGDKIENQWAQREISIDGNDQDWEGIQKYYLEDQNMSIGTANDSTDLYLMFRLNDERMIRQIQMMGVTVWLSRDGKKRKDYGICYSGSTGLYDRFRPEMPADDRMPKEMDERIEKMQAEREAQVPGLDKIFIIQGDEKNESDAVTPQCPSAGSAYRNGVYCYEFRIPLPIGVKLKKGVMIGLVFGGMSEHDRNAMRGEMGGKPGDGKRPGGDMGGGPGGMGGRPGGPGGPKGPGGVRGGERPPGGAGMEQQEVWLKIIPAEKSTPTD